MSNPGLVAIDYPDLSSEPRKLMRTSFLLPFSTFTSSTPSFDGCVPRSCFTFALSALSVPYPFLLFAFIVARHPRLVNVSLFSFLESRGVGSDIINSLTPDLIANPSLTHIRSPPAAELCRRTLDGTVKQTMRTFDSFPPHVGPHVVGPRTAAKDDS